LPARPGESQKDVTLKSEDDDSDDETVDDSSDKSDAGRSSDAKSGAKSEAKTDAKSAASSGPQDAYIAPEMKHYSRIFRFGQDLLISTSIGSAKTGPAKDSSIKNSNAAQKLFLIDTGSLTNFISPEAAREVTKVGRDSDTIVEGISGRVDKVFSADKAVLIFGHLKQENQDMTAFDTKPISDSIGTEVSGFLGFTTLRMLDIKIDYRDALVDFAYDAKRFGR
jgi:hypothetical protein